MFGMCTLAVMLLTALGNEHSFYLLFQLAFSKVSHSRPMQSFTWKAYKVILVFQFCGGLSETL